MELVTMLAEQLQDETDFTYLPSVEMAGYEAVDFLLSNCNLFSAYSSHLPEYYTTNEEQYFYLNGYTELITMCITVSNKDKHIDKRTKPWRDLMKDYSVDKFIDLLYDLSSPVSIDFSIQPKEDI